MYILQQAKKCNTNLVIARPKTTATTQKKKAQHQLKCIQQTFITQTCKYAQKIHNIAFATRSKPGQRRQQDFWENETPDQHFLKQKSKKFD